MRKNSIHKNPTTVVTSSQSRKSTPPKVTSLLGFTFTYIFCLNRNKLQGSKQIFSFGFPHLSYKNIDKASPARQVRQTVPTYNRKLVYPLQNKILYCCTSLFYIRKQKRRLFTIIQIIVTFFVFLCVKLNKLSWRFYDEK